MLENGNCVDDSRVGSVVRSGIWEIEGSWNGSHIALKREEGRKTFETSVVKLKCGDGKFGFNFLQ